MMAVGGIMLANLFRIKRTKSVSWKAATAATAVASQRHGSLLIKYVKMPLSSSLLRCQGPPCPS